MKKNKLVLWHQINKERNWNYIRLGKVIDTNKNIQVKSEVKSEVKSQEKSQEINTFLIKKDAKPDVYHVYDMSNNLIHFASIPDTHTSQLVFNALKNVDSANFKCIMCPKWKRYKPVELVS